MSLKTITPVTGVVSTTNDTWTTIASCNISQNCTVGIKDIFVVSRSTDAPVGEMAFATAMHRAKRVGGVLSLVGSLLYIMTFNTGSDNSLKSCALQLTVTGNSLNLQVRGIGGDTPRNIDWYGGFTVILH